MFKKDPCVDVLEVRVDSLPFPPAPEEILALPCPAIVTLRDFAEGGVLPLDLATREMLYLEYLSAAAAVDVEIANLRKLARVVQKAKALKVPVVASFHDFEKTPSLRTLIGAAAKARREGASCVKVATSLRTTKDLAVLVSLLEEVEGPLAVMGMGPLGRVSRLVLHRCGSKLNYCWLGKPQVPGQWSAKDFGKALELLDR